MPIGPFDDFDDCKSTLMDEEGYDEETAEAICGEMEAEAKAENGDPGELWDAIKEAAGLMTDVGVDLNSAVDVPAIDSSWVAMKDADDGTALQAPLVVKQEGDAEKRIAYAPAMIPREPDKEGDVVGTATVENAAHDYLVSDGDVDTDHNLVDGKGEVVESWIEPDAREWDTPSGESKEYPAGTWMLGIKWESEPWERIQSGDLEGLSIYGRAEQVPLEKSVAKDLTVPFADEVVVDLVYGAQVAAEKAAEAMGMDAETHRHELDGRTVWMPGPDHETYVDTYNDIAEGDGSVEASKADEDPCWEGYTMVGTDDNGDPRCVPDDEVPDADFSESLTPAETKAAAKGATPKGDSTEHTEQDSMTDDSTEDGTDGKSDDSPDVAALAEKVDGLADTVSDIESAVKADDMDDDEDDEDDDPEMNSTDKENADELISEFAEDLAAMEDVELGESDIAAMIDDALKGDDEDDEYEDKEKSANVSKGHGDGSGAAAATNDGGAASGNPLSNRADAIEGDY
jgi:hypothetical protein